MLAELQEEIQTENEISEEMRSFNHSYICTRIMRQLFQNETVEPMPELTLDIGKGITPDISIFPKEKIQPNFLRDITKFPEMPILAIEVISASQNTQDSLEKAENMVRAGVKTVWTIEPFGQTIFVTTKEGEKIFHNQEIESEGIKVDFRKIFGAS